jgi:hypothetical protein
MASEVTLPGGKRANKWVVIAIAVGGSAVAYVVYKNHAASSASSASSATSGEVTDPSTGVSYPAGSTDPTTGETYAQEIGQYGSVEAADAAVAQTADSYLYNQGDLYGTGYGGSEYSTGTYGATTTVSGSVYTSNSAWAQAAEAGLTDIGYTGTDVASALGLYLTGMPVTSDQAAIITAAIGEYGAPPVGTFQIITQPNGGTATVAVPNVIGRTDLSTAESIITAAGLKAAATGSSGAGNKGSVTAQSPAAGTQVSKGSTVTVTYTVKAATAAATVTVPKVTGLEADQAQPILSSTGLKSTLSGPSFKAGGSTVRMITAQSPSAGSKATKGTTVKLTYKVQQNSLVPKGK